MTPSPRRRLATGFGVLTLVASLLASGSYASLTLLAPLEPVIATIDAHPVAQPEQPELAFPDYGGSAIAAIGYPDARIAHGIDTPMQLASITKVITALVVLEEKPLAPGTAGPALTFDASDVARYRYHLRNNGSNEPVWAGLRLSQRDVLRAVLISSANNYAESLAEWAFGSIDAFVARANAWLENHGMLDARIVEPSGFDARNVATTDDLLTLAQLALNEPTIAAIVAEKTATVSRLGELENSNRLLGSDGIDGIKTGTLDYYNLLFSADLTVGEHTVTVVGTVLGASSREARDASVRSLVQSIQDGFETRELISAGTAIAHYTTPWGDEARAVTASGARVLAWRGSAASSSVTLDSVLVGAPTRLVGSVQFRVGQRTLTVPLILEGTLDDPGPWWRLTNPAALIG